MTPTPSPEVSGAITALVQGRHQQPHDLLGQHLEPGGLRLRVLKPLAQSVRVRFEDGEELELAHEAEGVWTAVRTDATRTMDYRLLVAWADGIEHLQDDPYRFAPTLGEVDLHLVNEGRHEQLWTVLGARLHEYDGPMGNVRGVSFAVWAPRAKAVRVIGDFNDWDGRIHPMRLIGASGVWELFVPDVGVGNIYKFEIRGADDVVRTKADPMARRTECPPNTGSVVDDSGHEWADTAWMDERSGRDPHQGPMSVYEVHLGSWRQGMSYRDLAEHLVNYVSDLGFTHVELLPVMEHPYGPSWGYQVTGYYAPTARFGTPDDFKYLVDRAAPGRHRRHPRLGAGALPPRRVRPRPVRRPAALRAPGPAPRRPARLGHPRVRLRPARGAQLPRRQRDLLARGVPHRRPAGRRRRLDALPRLLAQGRRVDPQRARRPRAPRGDRPAPGGQRDGLQAVPGIVTIAEESTSWPGVTKATSSGGLGFGLKWNMGWMNDTLRYLKEEPIHRQYHHNLLTFSLMYAFSENYLLPISHDEVVHGKGSLLTKIPGSREEQLATLRAFLAYMWSHPGKQLLFMGCEFAQPGEWADGRSLDWWLLDHAAHYRVHALVKELNRVYREHPAHVGAGLPAGRLPLARRRRQHRQRAVLPALRAAGPAGRRRRHGRQLQRRRQGVGARRGAPAGPLGGRARHQRVRRGQQPEPGRRRARGRGVAVARPAVLGDRAGRRLATLYLAPAAAAG